MSVGEIILKDLAKINGYPNAQKRQMHIHLNVAPVDIYVRLD